jgi:molybdenum cofactor cytidylyltransferase
VRVTPASVPRPDRVGAVVLAAGAGRRFVAPDGSHKLMAPRGGRPVVAWAVEAAVAAGLERTWVVTGAIDLAGVVGAGAEILANPDWAGGQATSLQVAVVAARVAGLDAIVVGLGDQPGVTASAWRSVADASAPIGVATYAGRRRNPVRLGREIWDLLPRTGDDGARVVIRSRPDLVYEVACDGQPGDIDTVEDLDRWNSGTISG